MRKAPAGWAWPERTEGEGWGHLSTPFTWPSAGPPLVPGSLRCCRPGRSVRKPWPLCRIAPSSWLMLKDPHRRHISCIAQLLPITGRPQEMECIPVGIRPGKGLAVPQRASLSHPKAPGRTLPNQTTRTAKNRIPREAICWVSLTPGLGRFLNPVVRRHCLQDTYLVESPAWPGFLT